MMSIGPVQALGPEGGPQTPNGNGSVARPRSTSASSAAVSGEQPDSGRLRNQELHSQQNSGTQDESLQDVVQVQHDSQVSNEIVIKYTDQASGRVILQVPSTEVLAVALGITQDLRNETKAERTSSAETVEGGKYGN